ncbi:MAG TPA: DUF2663 family protein [Bacillales bacterium]|nr:DUF2663 family protein [Bacillales bacterium]
MKGITADQFGSHVDEATLKVINELIDRKQDEIRWESSVTRTAIYLLVMFSAMVLYLLFFKQGSDFSPTLKGFREVLVSDPPFMIFSIGLIAGLIRLRHVSKEHEDADDDFEELRLELIERSEEFFSQQEQWHNRHHVFNYLQKEYDINLFHK